VTLILMFIHSSFYINWTCI